MIYLEVFMIALCCVIIIDGTDFVDSVKSLVKKVLNIPQHKPIQLKPFDCSLCTTFWVSLIYILIMSELAFLTLTYIIVVAFFTDIIHSMLILIKDILAKAIRTISSWIQN